MTILHQNPFYPVLCNRSTPLSGKTARGNCGYLDFGMPELRAVLVVGVGGEGSWVGLVL